MPLIRRSPTSVVQHGGQEGRGLQGDSAALSIQRGFAPRVSAATGSTSGAAGSFTSLSQIGVAFQKDGSLALDATRLQTAMDASFDQIASLFAANGKSTDSLIAYSGATDKTCGRKLCHNNRPAGYHGQPHREPGSRADHYRRRQ